MSSYEALVSAEVNTVSLGKGRPCYFGKRERLLLIPLSIQGDLGI